MSHLCLRKLQAGSLAPDRWGSVDAGRLPGATVCASPASTATLTDRSVTRTASTPQPTMESTGAPRRALGSEPMVGGGVVPLPGRPQVGRRRAHLNQSAGACPARTDFWPGHGHTHTLRHSQVLTHHSHTHNHTQPHTHTHTHILTHASQPHTCTHTSQPDTHSHMPHTTRTHTPHALTRIHSHTHTPSVAEFGPCVASFSRPRSSSQVTRGWCGKSGL